MKKRILLFMILLTGLCASAQSSFDKNITAAVKQLVCAEPNERTPVTLSAKYVMEQDSIAVIIKVKIAPGWHVYQYVPATMPYIPMDPILKLPADWRAVGKWEMSKPTPSSDDPGVSIYQDNAVLIHKVIRNRTLKGIIQTGLYYQTCNLRQCLPPVEQTFDLKVESKI